MQTIINMHKRLLQFNDVLNRKNSSKSFSVTRESLVLNKLNFHKCDSVKDMWTLDSKIYVKIINSCLAQKKSAIWLLIYGK